MNKNRTEKFKCFIFEKTQQDIAKIVEEKYDKKYLIDGGKGVANFAYEYIIEKKTLET